MRSPAAEVVRDVVTYRGAISIRGIGPTASAAAAAATAETASDMQRQRRALIDDRQPRLNVGRHACAHCRRDHLVRHINGFSHYNRQASRQTHMRTDTRTYRHRDNGGHTQTSLSAADTGSESICHLSGGDHLFLNPARPTSTYAVQPLTSKIINSHRFRLFAFNPFSAVGIISGIIVTIGDNILPV